MREYPTVTDPSPFSEERTLLTEDAVRIRAGHVPGPGGDAALVVAHGFNAGIGKAPNLRVVRILAERFPIVAPEFRGHGDSDGECTLGDKEILDLEAAVRWARTLGYSRIATVGFSMGASIVVRHAGLVGGVDAVVEVSGPAFWNYRGTPIMRMLHFGVENPLARQWLTRVMGTRVVEPPWPEPWPESPVEAAEHIPPTPFLVVHGTQDGFFPLEHPMAIANAAHTGAEARGVRDHTELWVEDFGHAEAAIETALLLRISDWLEPRLR
ncbi:MAG: alpha/beta fold hydrolase [Candidatus Nanopelagicales bacterium]